MKKFNLSYFLIALSVVIAIAAVLMWVVRSREIQERGDDQQQVEQAPGKDPALLPNGGGVDPGGSDPENPEVGLNPLDPLRKAASPDALMEEIAKSLNELDMERFTQLSGGSIDAKSLDAVRDYATQQKGLGRMLHTREVGEVELNETYRWAIGVDEDGSVIYLDVKKGPKGWIVERVVLPGDKSAQGADGDSLIVAESFVQAVLKQDFEKARLYVDGRKVSDARIAGLCIIFEEGKYTLREQKPLRLLLKREEAASYLANVVTEDGSETAQFGINLNFKAEPAAWKVSEINLDRLLADYAQRVAGGDVYYSPLVRNPEGGDTLALYFGFDEDEINPRTRRQLEIVASILKSDPVKKLTLSGHTDSKGTDQYNKSLSMRRAEAVKAFLLDAGVEAGQVVTMAKGDSEPRRPNITETGADNPDGRRANRRTEIYLDF